MRLSRRSLLASAVAGTAAASSGALGYARLISGDRFLTASFGTQPVAERPGFESHAEPLQSDERIEREFNAEADRIQELHSRQTVETVAALKSKYEHSVFGRMRVWDLIETLARCVDTTDTRLFCASQWLHMQQTLAAMEQAGVDDPDLHLIAILHDLGKVFLLSGEVPENVVCGSNRIGTYPPGIGLDQMVYQFGHGEMIYSRVRGHVPEHVAFAVRYHSLDLFDNLLYMSDGDRVLFEKYVVAFRQFDHYSKSPKWVPALDMTKYRELIEGYFPEPILF